MSQGLGTCRNSVPSIPSAERLTRRQMMFNDIRNNFNTIFTWEAMVHPSLYSLGDTRSDKHSARGKREEIASNGEDDTANPVEPPLWQVVAKSSSILRSGMLRRASRKKVAFYCFVA